MPKLLLILLFSLLLAACGSSPKSTPAPVSDGNGASRSPSPVQSPVEPGSARVQAYKPPARVAVARPQPAKAVRVLMRRAQDQSNAGQLDAAAVSLERALRIEPRNARLWNRLAHVRVRQQRYAEVESLAAKSNSFALGEQALIADNWHLIARARAARGDRAGARRARANATVNN